MKIAYFDTFAGIAGDMVLGAFVSSGIDPDKLRAGLAGLKLGNFELRTNKVSRNGISATKVDVLVDGKMEKVAEYGSETNLHHVGHSPHEHHHSEEHGRSYLDIKELIESASVTDFVKSRSLEILRRIGEAESEIHDTPIERIHFHEVGAVDSIVDIVGCAICLELSQVEAVYTSPIRMGSGAYIEAQHGVLPVPGPAALNILKNYPVVLNDIPSELTTPTGAAIVAALSKGVLKDRPIEIEGIGYGAGSRDLGRLPNLLRLIVGRIDPDLEEDHVVLIETNMDDINPQIVPHVIERLLSIGATDAFVVPVIMKKGRPGFMLSVLTSETMLEKISRMIFAETTTLGLRISNTRRVKVHRESKSVETSFGVVRVKESQIDGKIRLAAEYDECKRIADSKSLPLLDVMQRLNLELNKE